MRCLTLSGVDIITISTLRGTWIPQLAVTHLWTIPLDLPVSDQVALQAFLSDEERAHAARFRFDEHRRRFIVRRGALRSIVAQYLALRPHEIEFRSGRFGKPWLPQASGELSFSASHSRELAIVAFASEGRLGSDIEWVQELPDRDDIARRFFTTGEQTDIENQADGERTPSFFRCWTRKEAFIKALGMGLQYPLDRFDVPVGRLVDDATVHVHDRAARAAGDWTVSDFEVPQGYVAATVHDRQSSHVQPLSWSPASCSDTSRDAPTASAAT
jgi:4'-phosphopantetheinyl transferase